MKTNNNIGKVMESISILVVSLIMTSAFAIVEENYIWLLPNVFVVIYVYFTLKKRKEVKIDLGDYFKKDSPEPLLECYSKIFSTSKIYDGDAWLAYNKSLVLCYYGEFEKAKSFMEAIDWSNRPPHIKLLDFTIEALIDYIKPENYNCGLNLSIKMKELGDISKYVHNAKQNKEFCDTYVEIGELLTGNIKKDFMQSLELRFMYAQFFPKLLIAWCLAKVYLKLGDKYKSNQYIDYCISNAPYCKPLQVFE